MNGLKRTCNDLEETINKKPFCQECFKNQFTIN